MSPSKPGLLYGFLAQFQVRFFGLLAYIVRFPKVAIDHPPAVYTRWLDTGEDEAYYPHAEGQ